MALAVAEFQGALSELSTRANERLSTLVGRMDTLDTVEQLDFISQAYPEIITPYSAAAGVLTTQWYDAQPTTTRGFVAVPADVDPVEQLAASSRWAMLQSNPVSALQGTATRTVFNGSRRTVLANVQRESGARWARHASANACKFCRMLATRTGIGKGSLYTSKAAATRVGAGATNARGNQSVGDKFHDHCRCVAVMVRPGDTYEPAPYVAKWTTTGEIIE